MQGMLQVLRLIDSLRKVKGRKKLQKIVHILKSCGHEFPQEFGYLHYGPYSSEVAAEVDSLVAGKLVNEEGEGLPNEAYVYTPGDAAQKLLAELEQTVQAAWSGLARQLNEKPVTELEAISTILYLKGNGFSGENLKTRFVELKPGLKHLYMKARAAADKLPKVV